LTSITERFLNDYNFHRRADEMASVYGDFAHAVEYYKKALAADPNNVDVRAKLGYAYSMLGDMAAAERECSLAVKQGPSHLPARLRLAYVYLQTGRVAEVTAEYEAILKNWPSSAEAHQNLAAALYQTGNLSAAVQHGREAVQIEPDRATAHLNLGVMLEELGKREESQAHYRAALRCDPLRAADCLQIAQRLATVPALTDDVIGLLKKVVHVKPKLAPAYALLGDVYFSQGNLTESLRNFRIAQESEPRADWLKAKIDEVTNLLKASKP
jgi:tetratricopeptide (TPR) repeat protein